MMIIFLAEKISGFADTLRMKDEFILPVVQLLYQKGPGEFVITGRGADQLAKLVKDDLKKLRKSEANVKLRGCGRHLISPGLPRPKNVLVVFVNVNILSENAVYELVWVRNFMACPPVDVKSRYFGIVCRSAINLIGVAVMKSNICYDFIFRGGSYRAGSAVRGIFHGKTGIDPAGFEVFAAVGYGRTRPALVGSRGKVVIIFQNSRSG